MQECAYKTHVHVKSDLKLLHLINTWTSTSQNIINETVDELRSSDKVRRHQFEQLLN